MRKLGSWWRGGAYHSLAWFVLLWLAGVAGAALLALPFHLLVAAARS